ncbi:MAG: hypothetical protein OQK82_03160, partial [Candidatus Pacearchaeota archaeon]|nr:hypothetical protein [Candidatus Pacearchaeota archaeon]
YLFPLSYPKIPAWLFIITAVCATSVCGGWKRIGFAGKEIRALAVGRDVMRDRQVVYTPVDDSGVFMISGPDDSMYQFPFHDSPEDRPVGKIHSLFVTENGATVLAGSDSGLYGATMYFSSLPMWRKTPLNSTETVIDIAESDSVLCAVTTSGVYFEKLAFGTWWACSTGSEPVRPVSGSVFTSVVSWPVGGIFAVGSASTVGDGSGGTVIFGSQDGHEWVDNQCIQGCTCSDGDVYSLAADSLITIFAGTSKGVFHGVDFDTGCWHSRTPQLEMPIRDMCLARMNTTGMPPDIYAATDSGVYLKSLQTSATGAWGRLFDLKTFAVEVMEVAGEHIVYAATVDGLWKYDKSTPVLRMRNRDIPQSAAEKSVMYSIDGRVLTQNTRKRYRGVFIIVSGNRIHSSIAGIHNKRL